MKEITVRGGHITLVDDDNYNLLSQHKWYLTNKGYVCTSIGGKTIRIHRLILDAPKGMDVDHADGNRLNNQRANLRICTRSQNMMNMRPRKKTTSRFKGVSFSPRHGKWEAYITKNYHQRRIGYYNSEEQAAAAYNEVARYEFGAFAHLNEVS